MELYYLAFLVFAEASQRNIELLLLQLVGSGMQGDAFSGLE